MNEKYEAPAIVDVEEDAEFAVAPGQNNPSDIK